jgi:methylmalonyl-CoA mutase
VPQVNAELQKYGRDDIMVIVGSAIPSQDYEFLFGALAIIGAGTIFSDPVISVMKILLA